jgi:halimadienyl-diphosphate synthase
MRAKTYLRVNLPKWSLKNYESISFEVIVPGMLTQLAAQGITFEFPARDELLKLYNEKLLIAGPELLYNGQSNLLFSLEGFGATLDFARLKSQQALSGGYGGSPAATAAVLIYGPQWDSQAARWLSYLTEHSFDGEPGAMPNAVIDTFEDAWVLYNLGHCGFNLKTDFPAPLLKRLTTWLKNCMNEQGASYSRFSAVPTDSDDTGVVLAALSLAGEEAPIQSLLHFERADYFACFELERGASITANAHVLAALLTDQETKADPMLATSIKKVVDYLLKARKPEGYWDDKWHYSPFYATACCVLAMVDHSNPSVIQELATSLNWVLQTQSESDGGWGWGSHSTLEETAYAIQIMQALEDKHLSGVDKATFRRAMARGIDYLCQNLPKFFPAYGESKLPRLWLGKVLYSPSRVILSAVLAVLKRAASTATKSHEVVSSVQLHYHRSNKQADSKELVLS